MTPEEQEELARRAAADLAAADRVTMGGALLGGDAERDELEAEELEADRRSGRSDELAELRARIEGQDQRLAEQSEFIRQMLEAGRTVPEIGAQTQAAARTEVQRAMVRAMLQAGGRKVIMIHPSHDPLQNWPVELGINGEVIKVKRGVPTEVPVEYIGVLEDARKDETMPLLDANDNPIPGGVTTSQLSYPYSILPGAVPEERLGLNFRGVDRDLAKGANQPRRAA